MLLAFSLNAVQISKHESQYFVQKARKEVAKRNFTLAKNYAKKAIQADPWNKSAWENYEDIIQHLADEGLISEFGAHADEEQPSSPKPASGGQFEGC